MKVTAVVPIFNEERTILNVLSTLNKSELISEIVVVDDASTDNSLELVRNFSSNKLKVIHLKNNVGKSGAVREVARNIYTDILFLCDGDLHNFKIEHIDQLLKSFINDRYSMSVGIRDRGLLHNMFVKKFGPLITGERALNFSIYQKTMNHPLMEDYGLELILNDYCNKNGIVIQREILKGVRQTMKPYKNKNWVIPLIKEIFDIMVVYLKLKFYSFQLEK
ncbi:MAG: glycosyltransferase family 2 protein [Candidatus Peribacteraceae bacterium]|nr:glycosyltransferase family 2 protein [Candidatus Peribacteraceae bacterium]